jgi:Flp pilus assembly protein TadG
MQAEYEAVFNFWVLWTPLTKLLFTLIFCAGLGAFVVSRKGSVALRVALLVVPVVGVTVAIIEFVQISPGYARIRRDVETGGIREVEGVFKASDTASHVHTYEIGDRRFEVSRSNYPALEPDEAVLRAVEGKCVNAEYTTRNEIVYLGIRTSGCERIDRPVERRRIDSWGVGWRDAACPGASRA